MLKNFSPHQLAEVAIANMTITEASFQFRSYRNYVQLIKAALRHAAHFVVKTFFFFV